MLSQMLAIEKEKLKLLQEKVDVAKANDDLAFFESLLPYMKTNCEKTSLQNENSNYCFFS